MRARAEHQPADSQGPSTAAEEGDDAWTQVRRRRQAPRCGAPAPRCLHPRRDGHAEEAELGASQDRACAADEWDGGHVLHSRRGAQPSGALGRAGSRRPRQGSSWCALQGRAWHARCCRGLRSQAVPLAVRSEALAMPRRARAAIRPVEPDSLERSRLVQQVINKVMLDGKKSLAERIVYDALAILGERTGKDPVEALEQSIKALTPVLEVRSRRVGGATYQVPVEVPQRRARTLAVRWLVQYARARREKTMAQRLANELMDATNQQGGAYKRKDDIYRMAQANKAFAHYRW